MATAARLDMGEATPVEQVPILPILGLRVAQFRGVEHAAASIMRAVKEKQRLFVYAANPEKAELSRDSRQLRAALEKASFGICDGVGISIASFMLRQGWIRRSTGIDLFEALVRRASAAGASVYLLGAEEAVNRNACQRLTIRYPHLRIAGSRDGYFSSSEAVLADINEKQPDLLFVALGSPRQEMWIAEHLQDLPVGVALGVGGTFDVIGGKAKRAPVWIRATGTEFLYRLILDPGRWRRQLALPHFLCRVIASSFFGLRERVR